jgi:hypothetical protein
MPHSNIDIKCAKEQSQSCSSQVSALGFSQKQQARRDAPVLIAYFKLLRSSVPPNGSRKSGAKTQTSKIPASKGTRPITITMMPAIPVSPKYPQAISTIPAMILVQRPAMDAKNENNPFII